MTPDRAERAPGRRRLPGVSVIADCAVFVAGLCVLVATLRWWVAAGSDPQLLRALAVSVPLGCVLTRFPLMVTNNMSGIYVPFAPVLLLYLLTTYPPATALLAWVATALTAYLVDHRAWTSRVFNAGSSMVSSALATLVVTSLAPADPLGPGQLAAVLAGAATYYGVDAALSAVSLAIESKASLLSELRDVGTAIGGGLFLLVSTLGYLAAVVQRQVPDWIAVLMLVPGMAVVVAAWAWRTATQRRRQQRELFQASVEVHGATSAEELLSALERHGAAVLSSGRLEVRAQPPGLREIGFALPEEDGQARLWLVAPGSAARQVHRYDEAAVQSLGSLASAALVRVRLTEEAERHARTDPLTGLANRREFTARLVAALERDEPSAVLFVDLDGFKAVNDTLGHAAGDELLVEAGLRLRDAVGTTGLTARLGGDEFAVLMPDTEPGGVEDVCDLVVQVLDQPFLLEAGPAAIAASVGATTSVPGDDADSMLSRADAAMYAAKRSGGARSVLSDTHQP